MVLSAVEYTFLREREREREHCEERNQMKDQSEPQLILQASAGNEKEKEKLLNEIKGRGEPSGTPAKVTIETISK